MMNLESYNWERTDVAHRRREDVYDYFEGGMNIKTLARFFNVSIRTIEDDIRIYKADNFIDITTKEKSFNSNMDWWQALGIKKSLRELATDFDVSVNTIRKWKKNRKS